MYTAMANASIYKKTKNILVIDSDRDFCKNVRLYLEQDYNVVTRQRLKYIDYTIILNKIDLLIIDEGFNKLNLLDFIQEIKQKHTHLKIIVMYTYFQSDKKTEKELFQFVDDMIAKPFDVKLLRNKVNQLFVGKMALA
jgi:DNA-binding response OmpR family regulator